MRVLLVNPPHSNMFPKGISLDREADVVHLPIGLLSLAGRASEHGHECRVVDMPVTEMTVDGLRASIERWEPELVGITGVTATYPNAIECAGAASELGIPVVMGGPHVTFEYADALTSGVCDYVVRGEGENAFGALLDALDQGGHPGSIPGIAYRDRDRVVSNGLARRLASAEELPDLDFSLLPMERYVELEALGTQTTRGCPFSCAFCSLRKQWGPHVLYRDPKRIAEEVRHLIETYDYADKDFLFYDDTFTLNHDHVKTLCREITEFGLRFRWKAMSRVDRVNVEILTAMREAGCYQISFGIESPNDDSLARIGKRVSSETARDAIAAAHAAGLAVEGYFIIGFPWETLDDMLRVVRSIGSFGLDSHGLALLTPYPGTTFYDDRERWGIDLPIPDWGRFNHLLPVARSERATLRDQAVAYAEYLASYVVSPVVD